MTAILVGEGGDALLASEVIGVGRLADTGRGLAANTPSGRQVFLARHDGRSDEISRAGTGLLIALGAIQAGKRNQPTSTTNHLRLVVQKLDPGLIASHSVELEVQTNLSDGTVVDPRRIDLRQAPADIITQCSHAAQGLWPEELEQAATGQIGFPREHGASQGQQPPRPRGVSPEAGRTQMDR